jgi:hypothetical protein
MEGLKFKRGTHSYSWSTEAEKGYIPHLNGRALPYIITKCDTLQDWGVWSFWGEGEHVCGGLTLKEAKESFTIFINK